MNKSEKPKKTDRTLTMTRKQFNIIVESVAAINARGRKSDLHHRDWALVELNTVAVANGDDPFPGIDVCIERIRQ